MSVHLFATIEVKAEGFARFTKVMGEVVPIVEAAGWKLVNAFSLRTGQLHTVIDLWQLDDFNHLDLGMRALAAHPNFPDIQTVLQETIIKETLCLADKLVYPGLEGR